MSFMSFDSFDFLQHKECQHLQQLSALFVFMTNGKTLYYVIFIVRCFAEKQMILGVQTKALDSLNIVKF